MQLQDFFVIFIIDNNNEHQLLSATTEGYMRRSLLYIRKKEKTMENGRIVHLYTILWQGAAIGLLIGIIGWIALLIQGSSLIQATPATQDYAIGIGSFVISDIHKHYLDDSGYKLVLHLKPWLLGYLLISTLAGAACVYVRWWRQKRRHHTSKVIRLIRRLRARVRNQVRLNQS